MATRPLKHSMNRASCWFALLIPLALVCFGLSSTAIAVCQQGCDLVHGGTFLGEDALINNTTGSNNTATGVHALEFNTTGSFNTANGSFALLNNTSGSYNTGTGFNALVSNTFGSENTATGHYALSANTAGGGNTADGRSALGANTSGSGNTATGFAALGNNTLGNDNTAAGIHALAINTIGSNNTAIGQSALLSNTTGSNNTALGINALSNNTTGSNNVALGDEAATNVFSGNDNIHIGNPGVIQESGHIRIGTQRVHMATFIAGITDVAVAGSQVIIDPNGRLGITASSKRFKDQIKPMDNASEAILALKPVTFRYKHDVDPDGVPQFGLIAEDVAKANPDLVARDVEGKPYTVRYEAVNAMLLNEFLKEHQTVQELKKQVAELTAGLQKVSAQLELSKSAPETVSNNR